MCLSRGGPEMPFVAGAVLWSAYTLAWFGWQALTDRVPPGEPNHIHWPSIMDLVKPGRIGVANRPPAAKGGTLNQQAGQILNSGSGPVTYSPAPFTGQFGNVKGGQDTGNILGG